MADEEGLPSRKSRNRQSRGRGLRKTTGCITCRKRHIKCDEQKPHCARCLRGSQMCIYVSRGTNVTPRTDSRNSPGVWSGNEGEKSVPQQQPPSQRAPHYPQSVSQPKVGVSGSPNHPNPWETNSRNDLAFPMSGNFTSGNTNSQAFSPVGLPAYAATAFSLGSNESVATMSTSSSQPTFHIAVSKWFDMLVGDASIENGMPNFDFGVGDFNHLDTARDQEGHVNAPGGQPDSAYGTAGPQGASPSSSSAQLLERRAPFFDRTAAAEKLRWQAPDTIVLLPHEHKVFRNFVQRISHWIDLFDPAQSFSIFVPHLAMRNLGLMKAILALSTRHLSLIQGVTEEQTQERNNALQYYNETLHYLSKAMQYDTYKTSLELLATALIVSTYEMLDGSGKDWERHLKGVFGIQRSQVIHGDSKGLRQAVWWAWLCQDVWAAFREKRKTFTFWKPTRNFDVLDPHEMAARSVYLMAQVINYCSREESEMEGGNITSRIDKADQLLEMLDEYQRYLTTEFTPLPFQDGVSNDVFQPIWIHPSSFGVALQIHYASRLLLLLNRPSRGGFGGYLQQSRLIAKFVGNVCGIAMTLTDHSSSVMSSQCLYIAGMCVQETSQREAVIELLGQCWKRTGWPVKSLGEELQAFWAATDNGQH